MIRRLYASNYRTLVNFEIDFGSLTLLLGPNGSGKTSVFEVMRALRDFVGGEHTASELFPGTTLTRWQHVNVQTYEATIAAEGGAFVYHLEIEHDEPRQKCRVKAERLTFDGRPLFESRLEQNQLTAQLYHDDGSRGPVALTDWTRSTIAAIQPRPENRLMTAFKHRMGSLLVTRFNPSIISARAEEESVALNWDASNFVGWFRHVASLDLELVGKLRPLLEEAIPGLTGLSLASDGAEAKVLKASFRVEGSSDSAGVSFPCRFDELSDGQRILMMLYTLLLAAGDDRTLCLDEPENFLALREINPWLNMLLDKTQMGSCQAVLISHHPELIDALAVGSGRWIYRGADGPSRVQNVSTDPTGLDVSELVARGWLHA